MNMLWSCFVIIYVYILKQRLLSALIRDASLCSECRDSCLLKVLKIRFCWQVNSKETPASISYFKAQGIPQKTEKRICKSQRMGGSAVQPRLLDTTANSWTHRSCGYLHETCTKMASAKNLIIPGGKGVIFFSCIVFYIKVYNSQLI